jgi:hypothetical protein
MNQLSFRLVVVANNLNWASLPEKIQAVCDFYAPVCTLIPEIIHTSLQPVFNNKYPELAPLYVVDRGWYDVNVATPYANRADFILFITPQSDHPGLVTYAGYMSFNNVGPWETTVFAQGEHDHTYVANLDLGDSFTLTAQHELSHAFYRFLGKPDATHRHFPTIGDPPCDNTPVNVLADFDFTTRFAVLEWLKGKLISALTTLKVIQKSHLQTIV